MSKFQIGDRVAVYGPSQTNEIKGSKRNTGIVFGFNTGEKDLINITLDGNKTFFNTFHIKQVRKLKKKELCGHGFITISDNNTQIKCQFCSEVAKVGWKNK